MGAISNVAVKVQIKGQAVGTLGWFAEWVKNSELVIRPTRYGVPGMFLHEKQNKKGETNKDHEGNSWICNPFTYSDFDSGSDIRTINNIKYACVKPYAPDWSGEYHLSDYPLTPACENALHEFIDKAVNEFATWYEKQ